MKKGHELVHEIQQTAAVFGRNKECNVVFEADGETAVAYTDGTEITLPSLPDNLEFTHEEVMTMRGLLDHEAGHVRHTDFASIKKFGDTQSQQAFSISNTLEDIRLEGLVMKEYPGSQKNFHTMRESVGAKELEYTKANQEVFTTITAPAIQSAIIRAGTLDYAGENNREMYNMLPDRFKAWGHKFADLARECKNTEEICNLALAVEKLLEESTLNKPPEPMPEDGESKPQGGKGLDGNPDDFEFDPNGDITQGKPSKDKGKGQPTGKKLRDAQGNEMLDDAINWVKENTQSKVDKYMKEAHPSGTDYRVLSNRWDEVFTKTSKNKRKDYRQKMMSEAPAVDYEKVKMELGGLVNTMKAKLRRALMAKENRDWDFAREHGRLDTKRIVAGSLGSPVVYKQRKDRMELDTAVHFLIDLSGSMGRTKSKVAMEATVAFSECLEGTQIRYQISGFDNGGDTDDLGRLIEEARTKCKRYHRYEPLNLFKFKEFNQSLQLAKGPISCISQCASGNNSDRDAVIWAYHELLNRPEKRKILFVLSDGQPANATINIRDTYDERGPLVKGLKNAIDECGEHGVECVGIGILTDHVKTIYPKSVSITKVEDLSGAIFNQLSNLLTGGKVRL
jgi:cobalamin biosynthesis protein CobT